MGTPLKIILAQLEAASYQFTVLALTREVAEQKMKNAWNAWRRQSGATSGWTDVCEDVNYHEMTLGKVAML